MKDTPANGSYGVIGSETAVFKSFTEEKMKCFV